MIQFSYILNGLFSEYCEKKFNLSSIDKLKHDLTSKCGEERRKMLH